jgi:EAL and modified HD-GYP domain-containing signal transduction protein
MDHYFTRQPIFDKRLDVCGYYLALGSETRDEVAAGPELRELTDRLRLFIDFTPDLLDADALPPGNGLERDSVTVVFGRSSPPGAEMMKLIKSNSYQTLVHLDYLLDNPALADYADVIRIDFSSVSLTAQYSLMKQYRSRVKFLAGRLASWEDFEKARDMGYDLFQGYFFLKPVLNPQLKEIKALDVSLVNVLHELDSPDPNFRRISTFIEHDLGLSYRLLKLANSAYMAPKYRIATIAQAITYLGTRELHQWVSMLLLGSLKSVENSELIKMSLIRGKLMALIAQKLKLFQSGSEPFFVGLFSLIDVILNKKMDDVLADLSLTEEVKEALRGTNNELRRLLTFVTDYEQAVIHRIGGSLTLDQLGSETMVSMVIEALKWAKADA